MSFPDSVVKSSWCFEEILLRGRDLGSIVDPVWGHTVRDWTKDTISG
jgi:hypothetical protein